MTTLAQGGMDADMEVLRAVGEHNAAKVGVYAATDQPAAVTAGDPIWLE